MNTPIHFIVSRSREGWAVNVESDLLSEHADPQQALTKARELVEDSRREGRDAAVVDLSVDPPETGTPD